MFKQSLLDRRLAETPDPFRSGARPLAAGMRDVLEAENARGTPPIVVFIDRVESTWPSLCITDNLKVVGGMVVAETLAPDLVPGRRKTAPRGSRMASGTLFIPAAPATPSDWNTSASLADDDAFHAAREMLERAAETFASIKAGKRLDEKHRNYLRLAINSLQLANAEPG